MGVWHHIKRVLRFRKLIHALVGCIGEATGSIGAESQAGPSLPARFFRDIYGRMSPPARGEASDLVVGQ
jgi:hypothetical protein